MWKYEERVDLGLQICTHISQVAIEFGPSEELQSQMCFDFLLFLDNSTEVQCTGWTSADACSRHLRNAKDV